VEILGLSCCGRPTEKEKGRAAEEPPGRESCEHTLLLHEIDSNGPFPWPLKLEILAQQDVPALPGVKLALWDMVLNLLDIAIATGCVLAVLLGAARGLARLLLVSGFLALGWWLALRYQIPVARTLIGVDDGPGLLVGFVLVFFVVALAGGFLGRLMVKLLRAAELRWVDRLAGACGGLLVAVLLAAAALLPLAAVLPRETPLVADSILAPHLLRLTGLLLPLVPVEVQAAYGSRQGEVGALFGGGGDRPQGP